MLTVSLQTSIHTLRIYYSWRCCWPLGLRAHGRKTCRERILSAVMVGLVATTRIITCVRQRIGIITNLLHHIIQVLTMECHLWPPISARMEGIMSLMQYGLSRRKVIRITTILNILLMANIWLSIGHWEIKVILDVCVFTLRNHQQMMTMPYLKLIG